MTINEARGQYKVLQEYEKLVNDQQSKKRMGLGFWDESNMKKLSTIMTPCNMSSINGEVKNICRCFLKKNLQKRMYESAS